MLPVEDFRAKLLSQRRELFRQASQTEDDLLGLETDLEREAEETWVLTPWNRYLDLTQHMNE
jgi:hypothetical protein